MARDNIFVAGNNCFFVARHKQSLNSLLCKLLQNESEPGYTCFRGGRTLRCRDRLCVDCRWRCWFNVIGWETQKALKLVVQIINLSPSLYIYIRFSPPSRYLHRMFQMFILFSIWILDSVVAATSAIIHPRHFIHRTKSNKSSICAIPCHRIL